jgi:hypothetical protein
MTRLPEMRARLVRKALNPTDLALKLAAPLYLDDDELHRRYIHVRDALFGLNATRWDWGSKAQREAFRELAADTDVLAAIQGVVASGMDVRIEWLAVLAADGSDASIDALIPHLVTALDKRDQRLDQLRDLSKHAADTPGMRKLFAEIATTTTSAARCRWRSCGLSA